MRQLHRALIATALLALPHHNLSAQTLPEWRFTEELRIGSENDDATGFSDLRGILVDAKGNIWILEASTQEIRVFDPSGKHLRNVGRKGQGPGEFIYADGMAPAPDGLIWVHDPQNARFSIFDQTGKFVRQQLATAGGYGFLWTGGIDSKGRIWDRLFIHDPKDPTAFKMRRASADWSRVDTLSMPHCGPTTPPVAGTDYYQFPRGTHTVPFYPSPISTLDYGTGTMWCAPSGTAYSLFKLGLETRDTLTRITRPAEPIMVSADERDTAIAQLKVFMKKVGEAPIDYSRIPKYKPLFRSAFVDGEGRLWLLRSSQDKNAVFDLFSPQGKPLGTLGIPHPVASYQRPVVRGNILYFIAQQDGEIPYVVRGRIGPAR